MRVSTDPNLWRPAVLTAMRDARIRPAIWVSSLLAVGAVAFWSEGFPFAAWAVGLTAAVLASVWLLLVIIGGAYEVTVRALPPRVTRSRWWFIGLMVTSLLLSSTALIGTVARWEDSSAQMLMAVAVAIGVLVLLGIWAAARQGREIESLTAAANPSDREAI